jgi:DNA-binding NtrC family response regulator
VTAGSGAEALTAIASVQPDVVLLDLQLPDTSGLDVLKAIRERQPACDIIMLTGHGTIDTAIEAIRLGAFDYLSKPCPLDELEVRIHRAQERQALRRRASLLERGLTPPDLGSEFIGTSPAFTRVLELLGRVAPTDSNVLITGETGTGKEMAAKLIHRLQPAASGRSSSLNAPRCRRACCRAGCSARAWCVHRGRSCQAGLVRGGRWRDGVPR